MNEDKEVQFFQGIIDQIVYGQDQFKPSTPKEQRKSIKHRYINDCFTFNASSYDPEQRELKIRNCHLKIGEYASKNCRLTGKEICKKLLHLLKTLKKRINQSSSPYKVDKITVEICDESAIFINSKYDDSIFTFELFNMNNLCGLKTFYMKELRAIPKSMTLEQYEGIWNECRSMTFDNLIKNRSITAPYNKISYEEMLKFYYFNHKYLITRDTTVQDIMKIINSILRKNHDYKNYLKTKFEMDTDNLMSLNREHPFFIIKSIIAKLRLLPWFSYIDRFSIYRKSSLKNRSIFDIPQSLPPTFDFSTFDEKVISYIENLTIEEKLFFNEHKEFFKLYFQLLDLNILYFISHIIISTLESIHFDFLIEDQTISHLELYKTNKFIVVI